jgi:hypothetical protein
VTERCTSKIYDRFGSWWYCIAPVDVAEHVICLEADSFFWWRYITPETLDRLDQALLPQFERSGTQ